MENKKYIFLKGLIGGIGLVFVQLLEALTQLIYLLLPLGLYLCILQFREKASRITNISTYADPNSTWQWVYPNFMLVTTKPTLFKEVVNKKHAKVLSFLNNNWKIISFIFQTLILGATALIAFILYKKFGS